MSGGVRLYNANMGTGTSMNIGALAPAGQGKPHNNMQPYRSLKFIIARRRIFTVAYVAWVPTDRRQAGGVLLHPPYALR